MRLDMDQVRANVHAATTEDLLDRATVWRSGMEPEVLDAIETELRERGVTSADIEAHAEDRAKHALARSDGVAAVCYRCHRPAVARVWSFGGLWGPVPLFPQRVFVCAAHRRDGWITIVSGFDRHPPE